LGGPKTIFIYPYTNSSAGTTNTLSLNGVINDGTPGYVVNDATISNAVTTITLASVAGVTTGASISGGGCIANGTTISAVNTATKVITLSQATTNTASISAGLAVMNVAGATAATSLTIQPKSSAGSTFVNVVLGNTANSFSGPVIFTNSQSGLVSILRIGKFGNSGENSSLGTFGNFTFGGASGSTCTLEYTGSGEVSTKSITFGGTSGGLGLSQSGTGLLKLAGTILPGTTTAARTLTLTGSSVGSGELAGNLSDPNGFALSVSKSGTNTWTLSGTNTYSGNTTIVGSGTGATNSVLRVVGTIALSPNTVLVGASGSSTTATLDLSLAGNYVVNSYGSSTATGNNINFTASSGSPTTLTFTNATNVVTASTSAGRSIMNNSANLTMDFLGAIDFSSSTTNDLTIGGAGNVRVRGPIFNTSTGVRSLTKGTGTGTLFLNGTNTYNGGTTISDGKLAMANPRAIPAGSTVVLSGGTLRVDYVDGNSGILGNLSVTDNSFIDLGVGTSGSTLKFASGTNWTSSRTLTISNASAGAKLYFNETNNVALAQIKSAENTNAVASLAADGLLTFSVPSSGSTYTGVGYAAGTENVIAANGLSNLMNYALGQNGPNAPFPALPVLSTDSNGMTLAATARTDDSSLRFYVEWTTDLSGVDDSWHATEVFAPNLTGTIEYGGVRKFLRFKVTK
jgi:autotransporter-associated beta strand protein